MVGIASLVLAAFAVGAMQSDGPEISAKKNLEALFKAYKDAPNEIRSGVKFLLDNMPGNDLKTYSADLLLSNTKLAYKAISEVPWGRKVPEDVFLNNVLPYANLDETREDWRTDLYARYIGLAKECKTPGEAAQKLNDKIYADLNVRYHATKRPKPNQSPSESIKASYASCTGLSILLVDACRAVGVPARIAGTALWFDKSGNHTWVEIWDNGEWKYIGAAEPGPFNQTWFSEKASKADPNKPINAIYAVSFKKTNDNFVLSWDRSNKSISAVNVTTRYMNEKETFLRIYPKPTESKLLEGTLVFKHHIIFEILGTDRTQPQDDIGKLRKLLQDRSYKIKVGTFVSSENRDSLVADIALAIYSEAKDLGEKGYELTINPDRAIIRAKTKIGLSRGLDAFMQLIPETSAAGDFLKIPCVRVKDVR